jgi:FemAB-related protein (PEP-CTERM system-associated)
VNALATDQRAGNVNQPVTVERLDPADAAAAKDWQGYVNGNSAATLCHSLRWLKVIERTYGHRPVYLMTRNAAGAATGVLPSFCVKSRIFGSALASMPFLDYGGACADDEASSEALLERALQLARSLGAHSLELRQLERPKAVQGVRLDKFTLLLDLAKGVDAVWESMSGKTRNQVRKAIKAGLCVEAVGVRGLEEFYDVFAVNMRDLGSPVHDPGFFVNVFDEFGDQVQLLAIRDGQSVIGGLVCLFDRDSIVVPWASCLRNQFPKCPNNLLYWEAIRLGCARGCARFDFGRSSVDSGAYRFKLQWGAKPVQIYWHTLPANCVPSVPSMQRDRYQTAVRLWKLLPVPVARLLGPRIRKYITN